MVMTLASVHGVGLEDVRTVQDRFQRNTRTFIGDILGVELSRKGVFV